MHYVLIFTSVHSYDNYLLNWSSKGDATVGQSGSYSVQLKSPTMIRAEEFQSRLNNDQPSFMKTLVRSHVASCFWMVHLEGFSYNLWFYLDKICGILFHLRLSTVYLQGLPVPFCKIHLPTKDTIVTLDDENGEELPIKYIAHKTGLSAGWRKFVAAIKLIEGDVLVFQLTGPCRFKVMS